MSRVLILLSWVATAFAVPDDLESYINQQMSKGNIPGASVAVLKKDEVIYQNAFGTTNPGSNKGPAVTNNSVFMFASLSKTHIAVASMMLVEKGWLAVDDDVNQYLNFSVRNPKHPDAPVTVRSLLTHTSSIHDNEYDNIPIYMTGDPSITLYDFLYGYLASDGRWATKGKSWAMYAPSSGTAGTFEYSNIGACLAAYICELVAVKNGFAKDFDDLVLSKIYAPLGAKPGDGGFFARDFTSLDNPAYASPSQKTKSGWDVCGVYSVPDYPTCDWRSSAGTYARLFGMVLNGGSFGGARVLTADSVAYMTAKSGFGSRGENVANVLWLYEENLISGYKEVIGHDGSDEGISTYAYWNAASSVGYILLTNGDLDQKGDLDDAALAIGARLMQTFDTAPQAAPTAAARRNATRLMNRRRRAAPQPSGYPGNQHAPGCKDI